jgi:hypothetical protein
MVGKSSACDRIKRGVESETARCRLRRVALQPRMFCFTGFLGCNRNQAVS